MDITIQTQIREDYLLVNSHGSFTTTALLKAAEKSLNIVIQNGLKKLLFDSIELEGNPPTLTERFAIGKAFVDLQRSMKVMIKCAFVGKEPIVDPERFSETVIVNRGLTFRVFTDITDAINWLKG